MKYLNLLIFVLGVCVFGGCSKPKLPPLEYMNRQSHLSLAHYNSVEYYKADKSIWNFPAWDPFVAVLYFDNQQYQQILQEVKQDTNFYEIHDKERLQKGFKVYFKKYLSPPPNCSMKNPAYVFNYPQEILDETIVFCNRVYFKHSLKGPFD